MDEVEHGEVHLVALSILQRRTRQPVLPMVAKVLIGAVAAASHQGAEDSVAEEALLDLFQALLSITAEEEVLEEEREEPVLL